MPCSICGSQGTNNKCCPDKEDVTNPNFDKHYQSVNRPKTEDVVVKPRPKSRLHAPGAQDKEVGVKARPKPKPRTSVDRIEEVIVKPVPKPRRRPEPVIVKPVPKPRMRPEPVIVKPVPKPRRRPEPVIVNVQPQNSQKQESRINKEMRDALKMRDYNSAAELINRGADIDNIDLEMLYPLTESIVNIQDLDYFISLVQDIRKEKKKQQIAEEKIKKQYLEALEKEEEKNRRQQIEVKDINDKESRIRRGDFLASTIKEKQVPIQTQTQTQTHQVRPSDQTAEKKREERVRRAQLMMDAIEKRKNNMK